MLSFSCSRRVCAASRIPWTAQMLTPSSSTDSLSATAKKQTPTPAEGASFRPNGTSGVNRQTAAESNEYYSPWKLHIMCTDDPCTGQPRRGWTVVRGPPPATRPCGEPLSTWQHGGDARAPRSRGTATQVSPQDGRAVTDRCWGAPSWPSYTTSATLTVRRSGHDEAL